MAPDFLKLHICAHQKAPCLAYSAACHQEHVPEHTQPYKCCTRASGLKHPETHLALSLVLHLQCNILHLLPNLLELEGTDTEKRIPKTASPESRVRFNQIKAQ